MGDRLNHASATVKIREEAPRTIGYFSACDRGVDCVSAYPSIMMQAAFLKFIKK
jgi:hypothetical protein